MTNSMSSSIRIYYECLHHYEMIKVTLPRVNVPTAVSSFAYDIAKVSYPLLDDSSVFITPSFSLSSSYPKNGWKHLPIYNITMNMQW